MHDKVFIVLFHDMSSNKRQANQEKETDCSKYKRNSVVNCKFIKAKVLQAQNEVDVYQTAYRQFNIALYKKCDASVEKEQVD